MKNIFYFVGLPGSGKTFFLKELQKKYKNNRKFIFLDEDEEICSKYNEKNINVFFKKYRNDGQKFYEEVNSNIKILAKRNPGNTYIVSTGGYSLLFRRETPHHKW